MKSLKDIHRKTDYYLNITVLMIASNYASTITLIRIWMN